MSPPILAIEDFSVVYRVPGQAGALHQRHDGGGSEV